MAAVINAEDGRSSGEGQPEPRIGVAERRSPDDRSAKAEVRHLMDVNIREPLERKRRCERPDVAPHGRWRRRREGGVVCLPHANLADGEQAEESLWFTAMRCQKLPHDIAGGGLACSMFVDRVHTVQELGGD